MGQRQRGGDGDAAGSRGAAVPTSPCPRGAELRGGDVQGPANPLAHKPQASSKKLLLLWGDHKTGARRVLSPCPEPAHGGCGVRRSAGGQHPSPWGPPAPWGSGRVVLGSVGFPWGHGIPFLGPWVVVFLGSQPRCSQRRAGAAPAPALRIWGDPQEGLCTPKKSPERRCPPHGGAVGGAEGAGPAGWGAQGASGAPLARAEPRCPAPAAVPTGPPITRLLPNRT